MADEEPGLVDSVTEATNGVGSEALAAISNLGGGSSDSIATGVVSRLAATVSGRSGGFAPKVITTITKHGIAGIQRVEPIEGVDRGYRAVAQDANGLESIRTVLDLDPRAYDVTVTREEGAGVVEFVQQEPERAEADETEDAGSAGADEPEHPARSPARGTTVEGREERRRVVDAGGPDAPAVETRRPDERDPELTRELQRVRAEAEKAKAEAEAEKARAEAEQARAEAEAAKARAEAERARARAETETLENGHDPATAETQELGTVEPSEPAAGKTVERPAFSSASTVDAGFEPDGSTASESDTDGGWGLRDESGYSESVESDTGFGEFTAAAPVEGRGSAGESAGETVEGATSAGGDTGSGETVADGGTTGESGSAEEGEGGVAIEDTGGFEF